MKRNILFILLTAPALHPLLAMEPDGKRLKTINEYPPAMPTIPEPEMKQYYQAREQERLAKLNFQLFSAAADGDTVRIEVLLARGAQINHRNNFSRAQINGVHYLWGNTCALELVAFFGHQAACELLLKRKATLTDMILFEPAKKGHAEICKVLIDAGADVNAQNENGQTPIMYCLERMIPQDKMLECTKVFLAYGADPNIPDSDGNSPLMRATYYGHLSLCELLIQYGADHTAINKVGNDANLESIQGEDDAAFDDPGENVYTHIRALLNDPEIRRAVILRADNPRPEIKRWRKTDANIFNAVLNRELGLL